MDVERIGAEGRWVRQIPAGGDVYHLADPPADGRWQRGTVVNALYFADSRETAWAEWYRYLAEAGIPPNMGLPRDLWQWEVDVNNVADLGDGARLARVGLPQPVPGRHQWPEFQAVGHQIHAEGFVGLVAPSAARPSGLVLCLFREAIHVPGTQPVPPPETFREPPRVPTGMTT